MKREDLVNEIQLKKSMLCVGLDTDFNKIPTHLQSLGILDGTLTFNKGIIQATKELAVAYKINTAFYEQYGALGWEIMEKTLDQIPSSIFTIADAKRGDIGNTSNMYAKAFFETLAFDSITVAPYMGEDSLSPFLKHKNKWVICLGLTSNEGSKDIQKHLLDNGTSVYMHTMQKVASWGTSQNIMFVTGATHPKELKELRDAFPYHFFLVPGVGAQGGSASEVIEAASIKKQGGLLINSSRGIIYAGNDENYAEASKLAAQNLVNQMQGFFS
jgi:orotidine-5'-phosphate decarboxylase